MAAMTTIQGTSYNSYYKHDSMILRKNGDDQEDHPSCTAMGEELIVACAFGVCNEQECQMLIPQQKHRALRSIIESDHASHDDFEGRDYEDGDEDKAKLITELVLCARDDESDECLDELMVYLSQNSTGLPIWDLFPPEQTGGQQ